MTDTVKSWIEERRAALVHVLKHPHPDPAAEWAQAALDALNAVHELHKPEAFEDEYNMQSGFMCESCYDPDKNEWVEWPCATVQAIEGAINHE